MTESRKDEAYLETSARESRERMSLRDWVEEAIQNGEFDEIDTMELGKNILDIYKHYFDDSHYFGMRVSVLINNELEEIVKPKYNEFWNE